jgi:hypothetical protein
MGLYFPVYPPSDLDKLSQQKRKQLANAIRQVLIHDTEVQTMLKAKTQATYDALLAAP